MSATMESLQLSISELQKRNRHLHEVKVSQGYNNSYTMPKLDYVTLGSYVKIVRGEGEPGNEARFMSSKRSLSDVT